VLTNRVGFQLCHVVEDELSHPEGTQSHASDQFNNENTSNTVKLEEFIKVIGICVSDFRPCK